MKEKYINTKFGKVFIRIDYEKNKRTLVLLHGFGLSHQTFDNLIKKLNNFRILRIDFLGFGKSDNPYKPMKLNDYVEILNEIIQKEIGQKDVYIIGHSFGARFGFKYASKYNVKKLFTINGKAFKNRSIKNKIKICIYKTKKLFYKVFLKKKLNSFIERYSSEDYKSVSGTMKKTFVNIVNYDLLRSIKKINCDVIVMASVNDKTVSYEESKKIYKNLKKGVFYTFYRSNHFSYIEEENKVVSIIRKEIK